MRRFGRWTLVETQWLGDTEPEQPREMILTLASDGQRSEGLLRKEDKWAVSLDFSNR